MHARTERIRADSIVIGAEQLHAVLAEVLKLTPSAAGSALGKPIDN